VADWTFSVPFPAKPELSAPACRFLLADPPSLCYAPVPAGGASATDLGHQTDLDAGAPLGATFLPSAPAMTLPPGATALPCTPAATRTVVTAAGAVGLLPACAGVDGAVSQLPSGRTARAAAVALPCLELGCSAATPTLVALPASLGELFPPPIPGLAVRGATLRLPPLPPGPLAVRLRRHGVAGILLLLQAAPVTPARSFEVALPLLRAPKMKRVAYTNTLDRREVFVLQSSRPDILSVVPDALALEPGETGRIGLRFSADVHQPQAVGVFISLCSAANGECLDRFFVKAVYS
jgi:hypothetical protein